MTHTIKHIRLLLNHQYDQLPKSLGVELVELGLMNYKKLTPQNYHYWWYEAEDKTKINPKKHTYQWQDLQPTQKFKWVKKLIHHHTDEESMYNLITPILNLASAKNLIDKHTGISDTQHVYELYYAQKTKIPQQTTLTFPNNEE